MGFERFMTSLLIILALSLSASVCETNCEFKAIFNFGNSNSDTGGYYAAFPPLHSPYGMTLGNPSGRLSDGRLIIDFLAEALGLPYLSPYLQSTGSNFKHGANFATSSSTMLLPNTTTFGSGISPFSLAVQLNQMKEFKARVTELGSSENLPSLEIFEKSLYTIYIGQNDFTSNLAEIGIKYLPQVVAQISDTIKKLYGLGGRTFLVLNTAPIGCYLRFLVELPRESSDLDQYGCMVSYNDAVMDYNKMLKDALLQTQKALPDASVIYVGTHSVYLGLFRNPTHQGVKHGTKDCCGEGGGAYNFNPKAICGSSKAAKACNDPYNYVSWDGVHLTEVANRIITSAILNGSYFDPPFSLNNLCDLKTISDNDLFTSE